MNCDAKIRPFLSAVEFGCTLNAGHTDDHVAEIRDYHYPGSCTLLHWHEGDRRTYHGDWPGICGYVPLAGPKPSCILPKGHRGEHAT